MRTSKALCCWRTSSHSGNVQAFSPKRSATYFASSNGKGLKPTSWQASTKVTVATPSKCASSGSLNACVIAIGGTADVGRCGCSQSKNSLTKIKTTIFSVSVPISNSEKGCSPELTHPRPQLEPPGSAACGVTSNEPRDS